MKEETSDIDHLKKLIKGIKFAMLTTVDAESRALHSRPLTLQEADFDGTLWFIVAKNKGPAVDLTNNTLVNLSLADLSNFNFVSISGRAEIVYDRKKIEELWNPAYKAWFPKGVDDPNVTLLKVYVQSADYWESPSSKIVRLVKFAQAAIAGGDRSDALGKRTHVEIH